MKTKIKITRMPELIQFIREKGKLTTKIRGDGTIERDARGKIIKTRENGLPRGVLVASMVEGEVRIGWSYVNKKAGDSFNKERGMKIAIGRMHKPAKIDSIPRQVMKTMNKSFYRRCENYFGVSFGN